VLSVPVTMVILPVTVPILCIVTTTWNRYQTAGTLPVQ